MYKWYHGPRGTPRGAAVNPGVLPPLPAPLRLPASRRTGSRSGLVPPGSQAPAWEVCGHVWLCSALGSARLPRGSAGTGAGALPAPCHPPSLRPLAGNREIQKRVILL